MILIFDLDNTLLDTEKFKEDKSLLFGLTPEENAIQGDELFKSKGLNYNPEAHIKFLRESGRIKTDAEAEGIKKEFDNLIKNIDKYLFSGVEETLKNLKEKGHYLVLMTLGDISIQKPKVENSRIKKYFDKILYETKDKSKNEFLADVSNKKEPVIIINDRANQAVSMSKAIGKNSKIFLVHGPESNNIKHKEIIHKDITELIDFCQNLS